MSTATLSRSQRDDAFVLVPRALLALRELCATDAMVLAHVHYRAARRHTVTAAEIVQLTGLHRSSAHASLRRLFESGWLDATLRPARPLPVGKQGSLQVRWAEVRELGRAEASVLAQLRSLPALRLANTSADGTRAAPGLIARMVGVCRDTARDVLARLSTGDTVRSRLASRRGQPVAKKSVIALTRDGRTCAPRVRIRLAVERVVAEPAVRPAPPPHGSSDTTWLDGYLDEHLEALRRKASPPAPKLGGPILL